VNVFLEATKRIKFNNTICHLRMKSIFWDITDEQREEFNELMSRSDDYDPDDFEKKYDEMMIKWEKTEEK
jgi:hypothetical protein